jgi:hypothetical protein
VYLPIGVVKQHIRLHFRERPLKWTEPGWQVGVDALYVRVLTSQLSSLFGMLDSSFEKILNLG